MSDPIIDAYSALEARLKVVDVITNNLANASMTGFKRDFATILQGHGMPVLSSSRSSINVGRGTVSIHGKLTQELGRLS